MARQKVEEVQETTNSTMVVGVEQLAKKIESLHGKDKQEFCRMLTKEEKKAYIDYCKERDLTMVTGTFHCFEPVGGSVSFTAVPYQGAEYTYVMEHGKTYTVPYCVAKHLSDEWRGIGTWYPTHKYILDERGNPAYGVGKKNYRYSFSGNFTL